MHKQKSNLSKKNKPTHYNFTYMKKKLEADLISIAHRILKLKNKSEIIQLYSETQKLYEKLSILKFIDENFGEVKPTIGKAEIETVIATAFENDEDKTIEEAVEIDKNEKKKKTAVKEVIEEKIAETPFIEIIIPETQENFIPEVEAEIIEEPKFEPHFDVSLDKKDAPEPEKTSTTKITFEELLGQAVNVPVFEKAEDVLKSAKSQSDYLENTKLQGSTTKTISIGLNDRIGFEKNLFNGSGEDLNRVLSQLNTHTSLQESQEFIDQFVKPDYNNWEGKDDYAIRFMEIIERKFV